MGQSFWRYLFDSDWQQRRDIEDLRDQLDMANAAQSSSASFAGGVSIGTLRRQVHELSATVMILVDMLAEAGALDREKLRARVEGVLENQREDVQPMPDPWRPSDASVPAPTPITGDPYRASRSQVPAQTMVTCSVCGSNVPERLTVITATGIVCDVCAARRA
jgi:hypothetical protein